MKKHEAIFQRLREELCNQVHFHVDEESKASVFILPFKDNLGDNFIIRLKENDRCYVMDDGGATKNTLFIMSETVGGAKSSSVVSALIKGFDAHFDQGEGLIKLEARPDEVIPKLLHFTKMLITLDTMLGEIAQKESEIVKPQRQSLGPRASQKLRRPLNPLIKAGMISHRFMVDGLTVPDWMVDFAYEPARTYLVHPSDMVVFITVDLAVLDPVIKASHAFSRAVDIKAAHRDYDIRIAFDRHGQNSASLNAANFLKQYQIVNDAYTTTDISEKEDFVRLVRKVNQETGMTLQI